MKRSVLCLSAAVLLLPLLTGCGGRDDLFSHVSDLRSDLFTAQTEEFTLTVACVDREYPFLTDGVVAPVSRTLEAVLVEKEPSGAEYELYFLEDTPRGGDMSYRSVSGDYYYSRGVEVFPEGSVSLRVIKDGTPQDLLATSVRTEKTISPEEALERAVEAEKETVHALEREGVFRGEFHVRLLRRDRTYYYVGIVSEEAIVSLLLDSETGEVLARRKTG